MKTNKENINNIKKQNEIKDNIKNFEINLKKYYSSDKNPQEIKNKILYNNNIKNDDSIEYKLNTIEIMEDSDNNEQLKLKRDLLGTNKNNNDIIEFAKNLNQYIPKYIIKNQ